MSEDTRDEYGIEVHRPEVPETFPFDEVKRGAGVIGETATGEIIFVLPPPAMAGTFFLLLGNHLNMSCPFLDSIAYHMKDPEMLEAGISGIEKGSMDNLLDGLKKRHKIENFSENMVHKGDEEMFNGMYYGVMTTLDLAAIATVMQELWNAVPERVREVTPEVTKIVRMWIASGEELLDDSTRMAAAFGAEGGLA